ncbi:MAG: undecaprenyl/decaprenyl-phosphate alpha-N-acetylglucosaminyl 1-phosphate transferase [Flavipsychrobacter sp.]|nr:undecaprenyl/decaprenyl-phosphate alpha-N-acetylglucosaminyl 1-phosphate transferase [Flavipsychrobacter sp.]
MASIPRIIYVSKRKRLFDIPDNKRKVHVNTVPNLGGIGIFFAYIIVTSIFISTSADKGNYMDKWNFISASSLLLFLTGINDDLVTLGPNKKFLAQFVAALITVCFADIRINSLHGFFGIEMLPYWASVGFTVLGVIFVTNAFNLIDGIDGLAGSVAVLCTFILGLCLAMMNNVGGACIAFSLMGAVIGFLRYNISPARIFMGDTGSLVIGFTIAILSIMFFHSFPPQPITRDMVTEFPLLGAVHSIRGAMVIALSVLFVPVFDSFRVFITRMLKGGSPFKADRTHLHHYLLDLGFSHGQTVSILITSNILIIVVALLVQDYNPNIALVCIFGLTFILFGILYFMRRNRLNQLKAMSAMGGNGIALATGPAFGLHENLPANGQREKKPHIKNLVNSEKE